MDKLNQKINEMCSQVQANMNKQAEQIMLDQLGDLLKDGLLVWEETQAVLVREGSEDEYKFKVTKLGRLKLRDRAVIEKLKAEVRGWEDASIQMLERKEALETKIAGLKRLIKEIDQTLRVPAAEYVPAISDVFTLIDRHLGKVFEDPAQLDLPGVKHFNGT